MVCTTDMPNIDVSKFKCPHQHLDGKNATSTFKLK